MAGSDNIPQAQAPVLDPSGNRFTLSWFQFFTSLDGLRKALVATGNLALQAANNLSDVADAVVAFTNIKQAADGADTGVVKGTQTASAASVIEIVQNGSKPILPKATKEYTITSTVTYCDSGSCTMRLQIDGVDVGTTANSVSTTEQEVTHTTANVVAVGQTLSVNITGNSACLNAVLQINYTYDLDV